MESKIKKAVSFAAVAAGLFTSAFAAPDDMHPRRGQDSHRQPPAGQIDEQPGMNRVITPAAGPRVSNGADVFITADFLLWRPQEEGMAYAFTGLGDNVANVGQGSVLQPGWRWEPGFKVGLGLNLDHDGWDLYAQYTWLQSERKDNTPFNSTLAPTWNIADNFNDLFSNVGNSVNSIRTAASTWKLEYNTIDLDLGRNFFVSQYLTTRPFFGFRGAWNKTNYQVTYTSPDGTYAIDATQYQMDNNQDYWGFGLRTGLNTGWHFTNEFGFYGDFALSTLWSEFKTGRVDTRKDIIGAGNPVNVINTQNNFYSIVPVTELEFGLRYETWFSDDDYHFLVQAGWSNLVWYNYNQTFKLAEEGSHGDLTLQGLTVKVRFDF